MVEAPSPTRHLPLAAIAAAQAIVRWELSILQERRFGKEARTRGAPQPGLLRFTEKGCSVRGATTQKCPPTLLIEPSPHAHILTHLMRCLQFSSCVTRGVKGKEVGEGRV